LASGDSIKSVGYAFRVSSNTVAQIIHETCYEIWCQLKDTVLRIPERKRWIKIAKDFEKMWHFVHCIGAIDGKHIALQVICLIYNFFVNSFLRIIVSIVLETVFLL